MILILIRMLLVVQLAVVLFENITLFPVSLLRDLLGPVHVLDEVVADPSRLGWPVTCPRVCCPHREVPSLPVGAGLGLVRQIGV